MLIEVMNFCLELVWGLFLFIWQCQESNLGFPYASHALIPQNHITQLINFNNTPCLFTKVKLLKENILYYITCVYVTFRIEKLVKKKKFAVALPKLLSLFSDLL